MTSGEHIESLSRVGSLDRDYCYKSVFCIAQVEIVWLTCVNVRKFASGKYDFVYVYKYESMNVVLQFTWDTAF